MNAFIFLARIKAHAIAVLGGLVVAFALIMVIEMVGHSLYPLPAGLDTSDVDELAAALEQAPVGALLFVLLGWTIGTGLGAWVAARLVEPMLGVARVIFGAIGLGPAAHGLEAGTMPVIDALVVSTILLFAGIANLVMLRHPMWFTIVGVIVFLPTAWVGGHLAMRR